jgi:hypothetical protein
MKVEASYPNNGRGPTGGNQPWRRHRRLTGSSRNDSGASRQQQSCRTQHTGSWHTRRVRTETSDSCWERLHPDHAVLMMSVTKDELRTAPEFRTTR